MIPIASAPQATACAASSGRVTPQILIRNIPMTLVARFIIRRRDRGVPGKYGVGAPRSRTNFAPWGTLDSRYDIP